MIYINNKVGGAPIPVLTEYPVQDVAKAGQRFWYCGDEWEYLTQQKIDILGWNVTPGFPSPIGRIFRKHLLYGKSRKSSYAQENSLMVNDNITIAIIDFLGAEFPNNLINFEISGMNISIVRNAKLLTNLSDIGTVKALNLSNCNLSTNSINDLFTQLPETIKVATINISSNPGSATCNPAIATAKGYIVVV